MKTEQTEPIEPITPNAQPYPQQAACTGFPSPRGQPDERGIGLQAKLIVFFRDNFSLKYPVRKRFSTLDFWRFFTSYEIHFEYFFEKFEI